MNTVDLMKCADLAAHLGKIVGVTPVWKGGYVRKGGYVIYDDDPLAMVLNLDSGCRKIATGDVGVLTLSKRATALMAEMSELVMESKQNGTTTIVLKDGNKIEVKENAAVVTAKYNQADRLDTEELMAWMGSDATCPFPDPHNCFKVTEKATGKEISLPAKQIQRIIGEETEDE